MTGFDSKSGKTAPESVLTYLAVGCSLLVLVLLGARQFTSTDLGYHLAFAETFFNSGKIVDHTPYIYTLPAPDAPAVDRPEPGPGNWYDEAGRYRFVNPNWLSQVIIYGFWRLGGEIGLDVLQLLIAAGLFAMMFKAMQRCLVPTYLIPPALLLVGLIINSRFNMRPELFGYLCLAAQYLLLAGLTARVNEPAVPTWRWVGIMMLIELFFINSHSFYILGLALTGAVTAEYCLAALISRVIDKDIVRFHEYGRVITRLVTAFVAMVLVCFINPWGWRLVWQPVQTLLYMKKYHIGGEKAAESPHPWDRILELRGTFTGNWPSRLSDYAVLVMLVLVAVVVISLLAGLFVALYRKKIAGRESAWSPRQAFTPRWAHIFMLAGMLSVGTQIRRNIGVASLIVVPSAVVCLSWYLRYLLAGKLDGMRMKLVIIVNAGVILLSVYGGAQIVSGEIFIKDNLPNGFGLGISKTMLPMGVCAWLNENAPDARIWTDFQSSSTMHFFTRPHKDVPILTNTWAYPPAILAAHVKYVEAKKPFNPLADKYRIDAVVLRSGWSVPLHRALGADPMWKIVYAEGVYVLYLRTDGRYGSLADRYEMRPGNFDIDAFVRQQVIQDPSFARAILYVSDTFKGVGDLDMAIDIIETGLNYLEPDMRGWRKLLALYSNREVIRRQNEDPRVVHDIKRMKYIAGKILALDPGDLETRATLERITRVLSVIETFSGKNENVK